MGVKIHSYKNGDSYDFSPIPAPEKGPISDAELPEKIAALEAAVESGGGGEVKFYPEVIKFSGTYTPSKGEIISINRIIDVGAYAIVQPYAGNYYFQRVLAKCISAEKTETEVTIDKTGTFSSSSIPSVGSTIDTWSGIMGDVGENIALHLRVQVGADEYMHVGWVLAQLTSIESGAHHYFKVLAILPDDYDGTLGTYTSFEQTSSLEVITVLDGEVKNVGEATITFNLNGGYVGSFSTNQSWDQTIELGSSSGKPKLYSPSITISGTTLTISNPTENKNYVDSYDIHIANVESGESIIVNAKKTIVDLGRFNLNSGSYLITVFAKGPMFNGASMYEDSSPSNTTSYTHDAKTNIPTLAGTSRWYKGTTYKSTITEITFDNTYEVTGNEIESWDASENTDGSVMCYLNGTSLIIKPISETNKVATESANNMFSDFSSLITINNLIALDTFNVTNMANMFYGCAALTTLNLRHFDTSRVTSMYCMFRGCKALTSLNVNGFDTSNVTSMYCMFYECESLTSLNVNSFDTSNVTEMASMFNRCRSLTTLNLRYFDTSNVTSMNSVFYYCSGLTTLDLSNFDTSNVTNMATMFQGCEALTTLDLGNFDTRNVTDMSWMFRGCKALTSLNVNGFDTSNVTSMTNMFYGCEALTADCSSWDVDNVTSYNNFNTNAPNVTPPVWVN